MTTVAPRSHTQLDANESNVKETIEQILIAFILAFIFRCFIVEAFVIPTGSMAPTLLGAHMDFRCPDCGYKWKVNYSGESDGDDVRVPAFAEETYAARCPNCGYRLPRLQPGDEANDATGAAIQYGDRILVQKYLYLLGEPSRWDVIVFKSPDTYGNERSGIEPYTQNYIKRLIGRPGETIMVLDGDIYVSNSTKPTEDLKPEDFTVQWKPYKAQEAMWRVINDADYEPRGQPRTYVTQRAVSDPSQPTGQHLINTVEKTEDLWRQPWTPADASWTLEGHRFTFDNAAGSGTVNFDVTATPDKHPMTDWLAYDISVSAMRKADNFKNEGYNPHDEPINNVSDVKLALSYRRMTGDGSLKLNLTKQDYKFTAEATPDSIKLWMTPPGAMTPTLVGERAMKFSDGFRRIEFTNADYRVAVRVDGGEVVATTPEQFHPDIPKLLADFDANRTHAPATVSIDADRQKCELAHVSLWRDVYYLNKEWTQTRNGQTYTYGYYWAMPDHFPNGRGMRQLMRLGPDEFFAMGDNSLMSSDGRCWLTPVNLGFERLTADAGRVPRRFLLGKAFFVYWPAGYAPVPSLPGFVPNFGEMRFIH